MGPNPQLSGRGLTELSEADFVNKMSSYYASLDSRIGRCVVLPLTFAFLFNPSTPELSRRDLTKHSLSTNDLDEPNIHEIDFTSLSGRDDVFHGTQVSQIDAYVFGHIANGNVII